MKKEDLIKMIMEEMPEEFKEMLNIKEKKEYVEVAKLTIKEFEKFVKNRERLGVIENLVGAIMDLGKEVDKRDKEWWENIEDKYNLKKGDTLKVNRENMTIEKEVEVKIDVKRGSFN